MQAENKVSAKQIQPQNQVQNKQISINEQIQTKKVLIVVGKMGHGKSSFIKMMVSDNDKPKIKCGQACISITNQCYLYELSSQTKNKMQLDLNEKIYLMDTPGLDSLNKTYLLIEQIKHMIVYEKCQIIRIIYIRSFSVTREFDQQQKSSLVEFHKIFPIKKSIKDKISLFVMTHLDNQYKKTNGLKNKRESLIKLFKQKGIFFIQNKRVEWMSSSQQDPQAFEQLLKNQKSKQLYQKQWIELGQILNQNTQKCTLQQFKAGIKQYEDNFYNNIQQLRENLKEKKIVSIDYEFKTPQISSKEKIMLGAGLISYCGIPLIGAGGAQAAIVAATSVTIGLACIPVSIALFTAAFGYKKYRQKQISKQIKQDAVEELKNNAKQIQKKQLQTIAINNLKALSLNEIMKQSQINTMILAFPHKDWCKQIKIKQAQIIRKDNKQEIDQFKQIKVTPPKNFFNKLFKKDNKDYYWSAYLKTNKKYKIQMQIQIPTTHLILEAIISSAKEIFDK